MVQVSEVQRSSFALLAVLTATLSVACTLETEESAQSAEGVLAVHAGLGEKDSGEAASPQARSRAVRVEVGGRDHVCALSEDGTLRCWGGNAHGQLGYGHTRPVARDEAQAVEVGGRVLDFALGLAHTCAVLESQRVRCWGDGAAGQLGYASTAAVGDDEAPASVGDVEVGDAVAAVAAGARHTCAVTTHGRVRCWGEGGWGQLGYGNTRSVGDDEPPASAGDVPVDAPVTTVRASDSFTCALLRSKTVRCWGFTNPAVPPIGDDEPAWAAPMLVFSGPALQLALGSFHLCVAIAGGRVDCYALYDNPDLPGLAFAQGGFRGADGRVKVSAGYMHSCALTGGKVDCWGYDYRGRLGPEAPPYPASVSAAHPVRVPLPGRAIDLVSRGLWQSCAVLEDGVVVCW